LRKIRVTRTARRDIATLLKRSENEFGKEAALRYEALLGQALRDLSDDPQRPGSQKWSELFLGARIYHLRFSRKRAQGSLGIVHNPRHFVVYREHDENVIEVIRVLHDSRDLQRHLPEG
jgi:toxin ParE1/3/4